MAEYDNTNSGILSVNDRRTKPTHPNFKGQCTIKMPSGELVEYWVSGWEKSGKKGPFVSLSFQPKEEKQEAASGASSSFLSSASNLPVGENFGKGSAAKKVEEDLDDSIPF